MASIDEKKAPVAQPEKIDDSHVEDTQKRPDSGSDLTPPNEYDLKHKPNLISNINAKLANPLAGKSHAQLIAQAEAFARENDMEDLVDEFRKGALIAQDPKVFESLDILTEEDKEVLRREISHKWRQPRELYSLVILCSIAAAVQGMDESVINGANLFFPQQFFDGPTNTGSNVWLLGLVNAAPYLCCAVLGCWLTDPLNNYFGRRGTIFITATISFLACIWSAVTNSWEHLFVARLFLGLGIGPKSSTVPVYSAECAPANIRGALVMMWQMWTAFGIMLGYSADLAFFYVPDKPNITGLNWRLMLGSAGFPAIIVVAQVFTCPESPRWLLGKGKARKAYESLATIRNSKIQATRDLFYMHVLIEEEKHLLAGRNRLTEMFTIGRNRRAALASCIVMFMQQFCGVNVIAYYSSTIFEQGGFSQVNAILASWGFGMLNFLFALPAVYTIDTFGRRNLLLTTFPLMAIFLLFTGMSFFIHQDVVGDPARIGCIALGIYLFCIVYSPGEGPVPFTYSAEAFPLYIRDLGMSLATATTWFFNFIVALTFPKFLEAFTPQGAFGWYAAWNVIGFFLILFFVPETKSLTLEELDQVFSVPTKVHAAYQLRQIPYFFKKYIFRQHVEKEQLYEHDKVDSRSLETEYVEKGSPQA